MDSVRVGVFVAALRREQGMTQKQLAEKIGVTNKAISRWETASAIRMVCRPRASLPFCRTVMLSRLQTIARASKHITRCLSRFPIISVGTLTRRLKSRSGTIRIFIYQGISKKYRLPPGCLASTLKRF